MKILSLLTYWTSRSRKPVAATWAHSIDAVRHLDNHMLKDIGAPDWVIAEVQRHQANAATRLRKLPPR